jgi:hypothetical protein
MAPGYAVACSGILRFRLYVIADSETLTSRGVASGERVWGEDPPQMPGAEDTRSSRRVPLTFALCRGYGEHALRLRGQRSPPA